MKSFTCILCSIATLILSGCATTNWENTLETALPELGHRNWIVVADSAYPLQSAAGIQTIATGADHFTVLEKVLDAVEGAPHVNPIILVDAELDSVSEGDAPGMEAYRETLGQMLSGRSAERIPHMDIISKLDADSELFKVLLLKTDLTLPYTSVFIKLDCGYWNGEKEERLRKAIDDGK
jgi:L-fucose mutarotase/ribose pyranase (RbsD/FucU family)